MFLVSGPQLVLAAAKHGLIGCMPSLNARDPATLDRWLAELTAAVEAMPAGGFAINLVVHDKYARFEDDLQLVQSHRVPLVISSVGSPVRLIEQVHRYGGAVFADVASLRHAKRAAEAGVDGMVLLCAGAGGNTGWLSPMAFVPAVREFYDGPLAVAGCISSGRSLRAVLALGADYGYAGTAFICASESLASPAYRESLVASNIDDVVLTEAVTGIASNILRESLQRWGIDPRAPGGGFAGIEPAGADAAKPWRDIWSAGQGVGAVKGSKPLAQLLEDWHATFRAAASSPSFRPLGETA
jgi:nitronate monooxygenase